MKKIYCDRCGKVVTLVHPLIEEQTQYVGSDIGFNIYRKPKFLGCTADPVDLCRDCSLKLRKMISDFLEESGEQDE